METAFLLDDIMKCMHVRRSIYPLPSAALLRVMSGMVCSLWGDSAASMDTVMLYPTLFSRMAAKVNNTMYNILVVHAIATYITY